MQEVVPRGERVRAGAASLSLNIARGSGTADTQEESTVNKAEIIDKLNAFPYAREDYWIITGGAMVLYGIREQTHDIDLGCNTRMTDALERDGFFDKYTESGRRHFRYGEDIEISENWLYDSVTDRLSSGPVAKAAPTVSALGLYLAAQCLMGLFV